MDGFTTKAFTMTESFLQTLAKVNFARRYYALCAEATMSPGSSAPRISVKELMVELRLHFQVHKAKGPGTVFRFEDQELDAHALIFAIVIPSYGGTFDPCLRFVEGHTERAGGNFPTLAGKSAEKEGIALPNPPYPRPEFAEANELPGLVLRCLEIAREVARALPKQ